MLIFLDFERAVLGGQHSEKENGLKEAVFRVQIDGFAEGVALVTSATLANILLILKGKHIVQWNQDAHSTIVLMRNNATHFLATRH